MKICVFGAGAVGGNLAALLAKGGAEVSVVARGPHLAAMRDHGISLSWKGETIHADVRASDDPATLGKQDAVIVTLKAPSLAGAAPGIATLLGPETPVVFAVNGIPWWYRPRTGPSLTMLDPDGAIERHIGRARTLAGVLFMSCTVTTPGHIDMAGTTNGLVLGEIEGGASARLAAIAAPLRAGGLWVDEAADIRPALWRKLGLNLASGPLAVLGGAALPALYTEKTVAEAAAALLAETTAIAAAEGVEAATDPALYLANARTLPHKPSILQDYEAGRPMEIAALLDAPLEIARRHGVGARVLGLIAGLVRRYRSLALFGQIASKPYDDLFGIRHQILIAVRQLVKTHRHSKRGSLPQSRQHWGEVVWDAQGENDPVNMRLNAVIEGIEKICRSAIQEIGEQPA